MTETEQQETILPDLMADLDLPRIPQQARSRRKRDALRAAASHLFIERGYEATTADDIAAEAGVSVGTFYAYYRNKRQLFLAEFATCVEDILSLRIGEIDLRLDPRQAIRAAIHQAMQRDESFYGLRRVWAELLPRDPEIATYQEQINQLIYREILTAVRRAVAAGLTWPDLDVEPTSWFITLLLDRAWDSEPGPAEAPAEELQRRRDVLADMIYRAIFKPSPRLPG